MARTAGPLGFFPPPPPFGLNINFSTIGPGGYFWPRSQPAAFDVHSPGPREVPGFSPRAAGAAGTLPGAGAGRAGGPQAGPGPSPLPRGWILSGPCGVPNDGINWGQGLQPSASPCPVPMGTGFCVVGRCPAQGETCPGGMPIWGGAPVPVGNPSWGVLFPVDAHPEGMPTPTGCLSLGKTDPKGIPPLVLGGKPAPGGCPPRRTPSQRDAHPTGCLSQRGTPAARDLPATELRPTFATSFPTPAAAKPHAGLWDRVQGQWPVPAPTVPAPVTSVPSLAPLLPQSRGEPSALARSGDGRCSFPVCRLVPPVAAPAAWPRRHQPRQPGKFQRRGCCSPGAMVMGATAVGTGATAGTAGMETGHGGRKEGEGGPPSPTLGEGRRKGNVGWTDGQTEGLMDRGWVVEDEEGGRGRLASGGGLGDIAPQTAAPLPPWNP